MLDKIEKLFPEALPAIRRQPIIIRIGLLVAMVAVSFAAARVWPLLLASLTEGRTVQVPVRFIAMILVGLLACSVAIALVVGFVRRSRLRRFVHEWVEFRRRLELLHMRIGVWLTQSQRRFDDPDWLEIRDGIADYFSRRTSLRHLLFILGEPTLIVQQSQHWLQLKSQQSVFKERDYLTPFSFLLDLGAPIASINLNGEAVWASLFISDEYLEYLQYKHPFLERVVKISPNKDLQSTVFGKMVKRRG